MTLEILISILALLLAAVGIIVPAVTTISGINDEARDRLAKWTRALASKAARFFHFLFALVAVLNGTLGVAIFGFDRAPITRASVLQLVLFLVNVAIGLYAFNKLADIRVAQRAAEKTESEKCLLK
ncbi:MAG: hypothetical protein EOP24_31895 [Hyphomicrobiales bacterium]|nr:MAG: hypothetical protein EOP24_31895 [Hyphomicrobiales bacterium]